LQTADADAVADSLDVAVSRVTDWIGQARLLAS
jgi:predicted flap endonuclease-1-like 5' DNA nuclease